MLYDIINKMGKTVNNENLVNNSNQPQQNQNSNKQNNKNMKTNVNSVDIQGMGNTIDLNKVMNLYTSSFTEGFMKVIKYYDSPLQELIVEEIKVKPPTIQKLKSKTINKGFEKLKNELLREKLQECKKVTYNPKTQVRVKDLGYKSIYYLDSLSKKKWNEYFLKGKVYLDQDVTTSRISKTILFDKSITKFFGKKDTPK